jgi:hypothetical protein
MLSDLDDPMSKAILAAARHDDAILHIAKRMTLVPTEARAKLLERCQEHLSALRTLNDEHFRASTFIASSIDALERGLASIAVLKSLEDHSDGSGNCPVCGTRITHLKDYTDMIYCGKCLDHISEPRQNFDSLEGFGLCCI